MSNFYRAKENLCLIRKTNEILKYKEHRTNKTLYLQNTNQRRSCRYRPQSKEDSVSPKYRENKTQYLQNKEQRRLCSYRTQSKEDPVSSEYRENKTQCIQNTEQRRSLYLHNTEQRRPCRY